LHRLKNQSNRRLSNRTALGIGLMIFGLTFYCLSDAVIKDLISTYGVCQAILLRASTRAISLLIAIYAEGDVRKIFYSERFACHMIRLAVNLFYTFSFIFALSLASLTTIYAFSYTSPLFMMLLSSLMLKEKIAIRQWLAVGIGFIGVMIAIDFGSSKMEFAALLVLFGAFMGALNKILMRRLATTEHSLTIAIYPNFVMIAVMLILQYFCSLFPNDLPIQCVLIWKPMPWAHWGLFSVIGVLTAAAQYAIAQSLRFAQTSVLASLEYFTLLWVIILDCVLWKKPPQVEILFGVALIIGSNLLNLSGNNSRSNTQTISLTREKPARSRAG